MERPQRCTGMALLTAAALLDAESKQAEQLIAMSSIPAHLRAQQFNQQHQPQQTGPLIQYSNARIMGFIGGPPTIGPVNYIFFLTFQRV